jgi:transposase
MEATGVYVIPVFEILDAHGLQVILVNARHVKNLPGRNDSTPTNAPSAERAREERTALRTRWAGAVRPGSGLHR